MRSTYAWLAPLFFGRLDGHAAEREPRRPPPKSAHKYCLKYSRRVFDLKVVKPGIKDAFIDNIAYYNAMRFWKFGLTTGIFVIIIIQFGGNLFRYCLVFVRQIIIIFVIVIVN